jgi:SAM-dependent methyltransferase
MTLHSFNLFKEQLIKHAKVFESSFSTLENEMAESWAPDFNNHLNKLFGDEPDHYKNAVIGYSKFAIDAMRLQVLFNKNKSYERITYNEACKKVYMNKQYMNDLYLPGLFVSNFLWRHHYNQFKYYQNNFLPLLNKTNDQRFYDIGTGTGFYTVQIYRHADTFKGYGIDISPYSRDFTKKHISAWGFQDEFTSLDKDIVNSHLEPLPYIQSIEVLEHLENPQIFLNSLRKLLKKGGYGFITAALTAPNADHIYLYWSPDEVIKQLNLAGFEVNDCFEEAAYPASNKDEYPPKIAAFIVS